MPVSHLRHGLATLDPVVALIVDDAAQYPLGLRGMDENGKEYVYVEADAAIALTDVCIIHADYGAEPITEALSEAGTGDGKSVGAAVAALASGKFGWLAIKGQGINVNTATTVVAYTPLQATTAAGRLDDTTAAATHFIQGLTLETAGASNIAPATLNYPQVQTYPQGV